MSSIPPALPPSAAATLLAQAATTATVVGATADLLALLNANPTLDLTVAPQQTAPGLLQMQTPAGPLLLKLALPISDGATLRLQVMNAGSGLPPLLRLLAVNGQPMVPGGPIGGPMGGPTVAAGPRMMPPLGDPSAPQTARLDALPKPAGAAAGFLATVVHPGSGQMPKGGQWALPAGTTFTVRINNLQLPPSSLPSPEPMPAQTAGARDAAIPTAAPPPGVGPAAAAADSRATVLQAVRAYAPTLPSPPGTGPAAGPAARPAEPPQQPRDSTVSAPPAGEPARPPPPATMAEHSPPMGGAKPSPLPAAPDPRAAPPSSQTSSPVEPAPITAPASEAKPGYSPPPPVSPGATPPVAAAPPGATPEPLSPGGFLADMSEEGSSIFGGTVAQNSYAGRPLIQTPLGLLSLDPGPDLPPGSKVELTLVTPPATPAPAAAAAAPETPLSAARSWAALDDILQTLHRIDPQAAQMLQQRLPDAGPRMGPAMILLAAAAQSGSASPLLGGGAVKSLEKAGRRDLLAKLEKDLGGLTTPVRLPLAGQWQSILLPLPLGQQIERIRLTLRKPADDDAESEARAEEGSRFLLDVEMSRLGPLQLDGLVKRRAKRFDLVVRSRAELSAEIRRDISAIFFRALEGLGMTGEANFQQAVNFIEPIPTDLRPATGMMI